MENMEKNPKLGKCVYEKLHLGKLINHCNGCFKN